MRHFFLLIAFLLSNTFISGQCEIGDIEIIDVTCSNTLFFNVELDFDYNNVGNSGFQVVGNGTSYGSYSYDDLPITIENLTGNCETEYEFVIRDILDQTCSSPGYELGQVCCEDNCLVEIMDSDVSDCVNDEIDLVFSVQTVNLFGNSLIITADTGFEEEVEVVNNTVEINGFDVEGSEVVQFRLSNPMDTSCYDEFIYESECVCSIDNVDIQVVECNPEDSTYYVLVDFDHTLTSDSFLIGGNSIFGGKFAYADLPVMVGPRDFSPTTEVNFLIQDGSSTFCFAGIELGVINNCDLACDLSMINVSTTECNEGTLDLEFSISGIHDGDQGFTVEWLDSIYGPFAYGEDSYTIENLGSYCGGDEVFILRDEAIATCVSEVPATDMCCSCEIWNLETEIDCENAALNYSFDYVGTTDKYLLRIFSDGEALYQEQYFYDNQLSVDLTEWADGVYVLYISESEDENCVALDTFTLDCGLLSCSLSDIVVEATECTEGFFNVHVDFNAVGVSDSFYLRGNGVLYGTYPYGEEFYEIENLAADCETIYEFIVIDQEDENCRIDTGLVEPICCTCFIEELQLSFMGCDTAGVARISVDLNLDGTDQREDVTLIHEDKVLGVYDPSDFPVIIEAEEGNNFVRVETENCNILEDINIECNSCTFENLEIALISCENNEGVVSIDGVIDVDPSVSLYVNGDLQGQYDNTDFPVEVNVMTETEYLFELYSSEYEVCKTELSLDPFTCPDGVSENPYNEKVYLTNQQLYIDTDRTLYSVSISNIMGQSISFTESSPSVIDLSHLPTGVLLVTVSDGDGSVTYKLVK